MDVLIRNVGFIYGLGINESGNGAGNFTENMAHNLRSTSELQKSTAL